MLFKNASNYTYMLNTAMVFLKDHEEDISRNLCP